MTRKSIPRSVVMSRVLSRYLDWAAHAPEGAGDYAVGGLLRTMRVRLGMTQAQLAKRCGLTQSHVANVEAGKVDAQWGTLAKMFAALRCRLVPAPMPEGGIEEMLRAQARKAARRKIARVSGTMTMEQQRPDEGMLDELVRAETDRLLQKRSSEIWDEP